MDTHLIWKWESLLILLLKKVRLQVEKKFTRMAIYSCVIMIALTCYTVEDACTKISNSSWYGPWCIACNSIYCCSRVCIQYGWANRHWPLIESRHARRHDSFKSRATPHGTTRWRVTPKHVARLSLARSAELPAWQVGRAKACGATLQWVAPRFLAWQKRLVFKNLNPDRLLLKF